jgi:tetratricopeptide (TPR) repeat protein
MSGPNQKSEFEFTCPNEPKLQLQSKREAAEYFSKLKLARREDLYIELANVMAAKYNLMSMPTRMTESESKQKLVTELTDKATWICAIALGKEAVVGYAGTDLREFNGLVMEIDNQVAAQNLEPEKHGEMLLINLRNCLNRSIGKKDNGDASAASYSEGMRLYDIGKYHAGRFETDKAMEFYNKSFEANKRPEPLIQRARIKMLRIRHHEALLDLLEAQRLDAMNENACQKEIMPQLAKLSVTTQTYKDGTREELIEDLRRNGRGYVARRILSTCFKIEPEQWDRNPPTSPMLKYHFFNEIDNIAKFESRGSYPEIQVYIDRYPGAFVEAQVQRCPDKKDYLATEIKLHLFLCSYEEQDMRNARSDMLYLIHSAMMWADYGHQAFSAGSGNRVIREALGYLDH